ncbi:MAG: ABC transporter substrate-binding protein [Chloroflexi bacterium]|nr:ABC transporter substrate-binding protein [Chloroflexota bacterium]
MNKKVSVILTLCLCFVFIAGCASGSPATASTQVSESETGATAEPEVAAGGRESIVRLTADSTPILDPATHAGNSTSIAYVNLFDTLVFPKGDGVVPDLAESWSVNDDGTEYTFKLKQGVLFHDGSELKASDVAFTAKRMITIGEGFAYLYSGIVEDVTADDDYTVTFHLTGPYGPFVSTLCRLYILNEDLVMKHLGDGTYGEFGDYGKNWLLTNDAGSGPYVVTELVQNDYFLATRFADWHMGWDGKENAPEQFKIIYGTEPATVRTMMSTQTLEITDMWQSPESLAALDEVEGVDLASYSTRLVQNIFFNTTLPPTDDVNVRKALSYLVDYDTLIDVAFTGSLKPIGPVSNFTSGHVDTTEFSYDIEKAKEYLAKSKYADNIGDYEIEFLYTDVAALEKVALSFQAACAEVGINVKITKGPWTTVQERVSAANSTPNAVTINSGPQFNEAGATLESQFHSKTAGTYENCSWIANDELDARIEDAMATVDQEERYQKYADLQNYIVDELCPSAWIADLVERVAYQSTYIDWPAAQATAKGEIDAYLMGYPFFMPDISIYTDK